MATSSGSAKALLRGRSSDRDGGAADDRDRAAGDGRCTRRPGRAARGVRGQHMEYLRRDRDLLLDGVGVPEIATDLAGKQVLVVVRGYNHREDLAALRRYIRAYRPVLIGVDAGADVLLDSGYQPALVVGDLDSLSHEALQCGAEIVVRTDPDGRAPDLDRIRNLGLTATEFAASGTSEDAALLLADAKGAALIATAGTPRDPRGVSRQGSLRDGEHLPDAAARRRQAR